MTGYQDRAAELAAWGEAQMALVKAEIEDALRAMSQGERLKPGDMPGAERKLRAAGVAARAIRSVMLMERAAGGGRRIDHETDDEMGEGDDPRTCERLRAELEPRFDQLHGRLEQAGLHVEPGCWPAARTEGRRVRPA